MVKPSIKELMEAAGISKSYACEILGTENTPPKTPSRPLAIHIFRKTGWRHDCIADLSNEQIDMLETIERWTPREATA